MPFSSDRVFRAVPGSWCDKQGHDGMEQDDHWEAHTETIEEIGVRAKEMAEKGWVTIVTGGRKR